MDRAQIGESKPGANSSFLVRGELEVCWCLLLSQSPCDHSLFLFSLCLLSLF